jgi:hypothetical protein
LAAVGLAGGTAATLNLEKDAVYRVTRPLSFTHLDGFTLNGSGASIINTARSSTMLFSATKNVKVRDLSIDYNVGASPTVMRTRSLDEDPDRRGLTCNRVRAADNVLRG